MTSPYLKARELGYSDEQISEYFSQKDPEFNSKYIKAKELGYSPEQIFNKNYESQKKSDELKNLQSLQDEDLDPEIERHLARLTSRGIEQTLGAPGNIRDLAYWVKDKVQNEGLSKIPGYKTLETVIPKLKEKTQTPESFKKFDETFPIASTVSNLLGYLPTSSQLKKKSSELTKGYTEPQGDIERVGDEVFESLVSSALPGQGARNVWRNIAAPIAGVLGKEAVKSAGGSEGSQALTQLGLNLAIPLMSGNAPKLNEDLWKDIRQNVPNVNVPSTQLLTEARNLKGKIQRGLGSKSETQAIKTVDNLIDKLERGHISAAELMAGNISLNEIIGDPELFGRGIHWFEEMRGLIHKGMDQVAKVSPEWYQKWKNANEIHGAIANSNYIAKTIKKNSSPLLSEGARALFGGAVHTASKGAALIPPVYLIYKGTQVLNRMAQSPQLLKYYTNILSNSLRGNTAAAASNLNKLDEALLKEEKKLKPPFKNSSQKQ